MQYYQTKFGCKPTSSLEDTTEIAIFWLYKPSLWPWHWTQWANFTAWHPGLWCCIIIPGLATKCSVVQKISSEQTFTISLNLRCDLDLESNNPIFHRTLRLMMLYYQTKFGCKPTSSLEDATEIVMFWWYKPSQWPWHWTQWKTFSTWHSGLWCCKNIPGLVTKCSVVQRLLSGQTFTNILNFRCDLDLEDSNLIFEQDTLAYDAVLSNHVWLQMEQQFRRYNRSSHILII